MVDALLGGGTGGESATVIIGASWNPGNGVVWVLVDALLGRGTGGESATVKIGESWNRGNGAVRGGMLVIVIIGEV